LELSDFRQPTMFPELRLELSPRQLLESLPLHERKIIERVWECAAHHYRYTRVRFERVDLEGLLKDLFHDRPRSLSSFDRAHHRHPLLLPWPIEHGMQRPWEHVDEQAVVLKADDQIAAGQLVFDQSGAYVQDAGGGLRRAKLIAAPNGVVTWTVPSLAAAVSGFSMLDGLDGKWDGVIHWCHVLTDLLAPRLMI
jgi:hypothetical protein